MHAAAELPSDRGVQLVRELLRRKLVDPLARDWFARACMRNCSFLRVLRLCSDVVALVRFSSLTDVSLSALP